MLYLLSFRWHVKRSKRKLIFNTSKVVHNALALSAKHTIFIEFVAYPILKHIAASAPTKRATSFSRSRWIGE